MLILTGYYQLNITPDKLREATIRAANYSRIGARGEANSWNGKVNVPGVEWKMEGATGVLTDKFGHWYILDFKLEGKTLSFVLVSDTNQEQRAFSLQKRDSEYWGQVRTLGVDEETNTIVNCVVMEAVGLFVPSHGIPYEMVVPPQRGGMH